MLLTLHTISGNNLQSARSILKLMQERLEEDLGDQNETIARTEIITSIKQFVGDNAKGRDKTVVEQSAPP